MEIKTYPEMNETIKDLLRRSEEPMNLYIVARIEELEKQLAKATEDLHFVMAGGDACTVCKNKCLMGTADACQPRWKGLDD